MPTLHNWNFKIRSVDAPYVLKLVIAERRNTILQYAP